MKKEVIILLAEDDDGHAALIRKNLVKSGITNEIMRFRDGQEILDFVFRKREEEDLEKTPFLVLLDIRMPKVDGVEVLRRLKKDSELKKVPVIMITTTDDPREIDRCHELGCSNYVTKPVDYEQFVTAIRSLGLFLSVVQIPEV